MRINFHQRVRKNARRFGRLGGAAGLDSGQLARYQPIPLSAELHFTVLYQGALSISIALSYVYFFLSKPL